MTNRIDGDAKHFPASAYVRTMNADSDANLRESLAREPYCNATASDRYGEHRCALLADHNGDCVCDCCEEPLPSGAAWEPDTVAEARGDK